jgi:hypothetical protein
VPLLLPPKTWQDNCAELYKKMDESLSNLAETIQLIEIK